MGDYKKVGLMTIILGLLVLSLEIYGLKLVLGVEVISENSFYTNAFKYLHDPVVMVSMGITLMVILMGFVLLFHKD